jgi:hypothetical protein
MSFAISLYDALVSIAVPSDRARAVVDAMEREMGATLATKSDILLLRQEVNQELTLIRKEMELLRSSMTVRLGSIQVIAAGLLFAALKLT